jgi:hypothetical protein
VLLKDLIDEKRVKEEGERRGDQGRGGEKWQRKLKSDQMGRQG